MEFKTILGEGRIFEDEDMSLHTSMRAGGKARFFLVPETRDELISLIQLLNNEKYPYYILGNGSNVIVRDGGYEGAIIQIGGDFRDVKLGGNTVIAEAGALLSYTASQVAAASLSGFEELSGIPGSIGGALYMNAGAYGREMIDVVVSAEVYDIYNEVVREMPAEEMLLSYRNSVFQSGNFLILSVTFLLEQGDQVEIENKMHEYTQRRNEKQPVEFPSAGSFFKRPEGSYAGMLIEQAGMKGRSVGGAMVSEKHAGFIINTGNASATDIMKLKDYVIEKVYEKSGYKLEPEPRIIGEDSVGKVNICG